MQWKVGEPFKIALFYRYVLIDDIEANISFLRKHCETLGLLGRILVSGEGLNGTLAGSIQAVDEFVKQLSEDERFSKIDWKFTVDNGDQLPFLGLSIRQVDEIISSGKAKSFINNNIQFNNDTYGGIVGTGTHLTPEEFHAAIAKKDGIILDVRNEFEYDIGHFQGSTNLKTFNYAETFGVLDELVVNKPQYRHETSVEEDSKQEQPQNVYMYCTGGIRCEKASAYLCAKGVKNVYQLEGGIHRYLEAYPDGGLFQGKNFVFDSRVAVGPSSISASGTATTDTTSQVAVGPSCSSTATTTTTTDTTNSSAISSCSSESTINNSNTIATKEVSNGESGNVVGSCIDCSAPHDVYSGHIVCTVCRMPVLVCPTCVSNSPTPNEYHCCRHRDLKELYFTVLSQFTPAQLSIQVEGLRKLEQESATYMNQLRTIERNERRQQRSKEYKYKSTTNQEGDEDMIVSEDCIGIMSEKTSSGSVYLDSSSTGAEQDQQQHHQQQYHSKQRRRTIRKQIERIEEYLRETEKLLHPTSSNSNSTNTNITTTSTVNIENDTNSEDVVLAAPVVAGREMNPKTRGGWGFWKS